MLGAESNFEKVSHTYLAAVSVCEEVKGRVHTLKSTGVFYLLTSRLDCMLAA